LPWHGADGTAHSTHTALLVIVPYVLPCKSLYKFTQLFILNFIKFEKQKNYTASMLNITDRLPALMQEIRLSEQLLPGHNRALESPTPRRS